MSKNGGCGMLPIAELTFKTPGVLATTGARNKKPSSRQSLFRRMRGCFSIRWSRHLVCGYAGRSPVRRCRSGRLKQGGLQLSMVGLVVQALVQRLAAAYKLYVLVRLTNWFLLLARRWRDQSL